MGRRPLTKWALLASTALTLTLLLPAATRADTTTGAVVTGSVTDQRTKQPVAGAQVAVGDVVVESGPDGKLPQLEIPLDALRTEVDVRAEAAGYAPWRFVGVELGIDRPVELQIELGDQPALWEPQPAAAEIPFDGMPEALNVGRTFSTACIYPPTNVQRVDRVEFKSYVKNVLPNEWIANWPAASLEAGAVAVQQYGWATSFVVRKWTRYGYPFDVTDGGCDQWYRDRDPARNYTLSDAAVDRMWGTVLLREGKLIPLYFRDRDSTCIRQGATKDCMGQWETYYLANDGWTSLQILHKYYDPVTEVNVAPSSRALQLGISADPTLRSGASQTLRACVRNAGTVAWQSGNVVLAVVNPDAPDQLLSSSQFASSQWLAPNRPATLSRQSVAPGADDAIGFAVAAPSNMAAGKYRFAVRLYDTATGKLLPIDEPFVWTITVTSSLGTPSLLARLWVPFASRSSTSTVLSCN